MTIRKIGLLLAALILSAAPVMKAQTATTAPITSPSPLFPIGQIDASDPDQAKTVPMDIVFRMWLIPNQNPDNLAALPGMLRLSPSDANALTSAIKAYANSFSQIVTPYRTAVANDDAAKKLNPKALPTANRNNFWSSVYSLVDNTYTGLSVSMSPQGFASLNDALNGFKQTMSVSPTDPGLGALAKRNLAEQNMYAILQLPNSPKGTLGDGQTVNYTTALNTTVSFPQKGQPFSVPTNVSNVDPDPYPWSPVAGEFYVVNGQLTPLHIGGYFGQTAAMIASGTQYGPSCSSTDQIMTITVGVIGDGNSFGGAAVRMSNTNGGQWYAAEFFYNGGAKEVLVQMINGNTYLNLESLPYNYQVGDQLTISAVGSSISVVITPANTGVAPQLLPLITDTTIPGVLGVSCPGITGNTSGTTANMSISGAFPGSGYSSTLQPVIAGDASGFAAGTKQQAKQSNQFLNNNLDLMFGGIYPSPIDLFNSYLDFSSSVTANFDVTTAPVDVSWESQIWIGGELFFDTQPITKKPKWWLAATWFLEESATVVGNKLVIKINPNCTAETTPPDYNPAHQYEIGGLDIDMTDNQFFGFGVCVSIFGAVTVCNSNLPGRWPALPFHSLNFRPYNCTSGSGTLYPFLGVAF